MKIHYICSQQKEPGPWGERRGGLRNRGDGERGGDLVYGGQHFFLFFCSPVTVHAMTSQTTAHFCQRPIQSIVKVGAESRVSSIIWSCTKTETVSVGQPRYRLPRRRQGRHEQRCTFSPTNHDSRWAVPSAENTALRSFKHCNDEIASCEREKRRAFGIWNGLDSSFI